jgi:hypothetical protein
MRRGRKSDAEVRFELLTWGAILVSGSLLFYFFYPTMPSLIILIPGIILCASTIYQDLQFDWKVTWLDYTVGGVAVATGLAGLLNTLFGDRFHLNWLVITILELGGILIIKALYDPSPRMND